MTHFGLDLSRYQHNTPVDYVQAANWLKWVSEGSGGFVWLNSAEPQLQADYLGFRAQGIPVGVYYYADPNTDPTAAARSVATYRPLALDLEQTAAGGWPATAGWALTFLAALPALTVVYSNLNFLTNMAGAPWGHPLWFAGTANPPAGSVIWQYGAIAVPGISGLVDINRWVGTEAQYEAMFGTQLPPAPPVYRQPVRKRGWLPWHWL